MSASVGLIVTGKCEQKGLCDSLARVFPEVRFELLDRVESFTSADVRELPEAAGSGTTLDKFAASLVAAVEEEPPDLVVAIDDLELVNAPHPELVASRVRDAVHAHLARHTWTSEATRDKVTQRVRERCSFHLLAPMIEAYFFAEPEALVRAGAGRPSQVDASSIDLEAFVTGDPDFLNHPDVAHKQSPKRKSWAIPLPERARHPKHYLRFLCDPTNPYTDRYVETKGGAEALRKLDWARVFAHTERVRLARSLFEDIADRLGVPHPFPGQGHPATADFKNARVLRNL
ncbi:hypothetical protein F0U60_48370 [Archangium minus]|uniref:Uncharacterized protein n=1 Tax=Archangium minus TaxID=83450 RepID=A0ABY9X6S1_9BACT|nr:hypothetical protein F0U60_48370 [Archangium minus]